MGVLANVSLWPRVRVGDISKSVNGRAFKSTEWSTQGLPIIRIQNLNKKTASFNYFEGCIDEKILVKDGDVLFAWSGTPGTSFGAHIWRGPDAALNQHIFKLEFDRARIDARFLSYALNRNVADYIAKAQGGVGLAHVTKSKFESSSIPLPSIDEQRKVVDELERQFSRLDDAVASLRRVKANLKRYKGSVLKAAVEGRLVETEACISRRDARSYESGEQLLQRILEVRRNQWSGRGKYKLPLAPEVHALPEVPLGWAWASVDALSTKVSDGVHKKPEYKLTGVPFLTVKNLTATPGISFEEARFISEQDHLEYCRRTRPERGDILITKDGTLGVVRLVDTDRQFSIFVSVALVKPVMRETSRYLAIAFQSHLVQRQMVPKGSGLQHIHLEDLRADCIPLPPLKEQERIVAEVDRRLSIVREVEAEVDANLKRAQSLRQAILAKAFSGASA